MAVGNWALMSRCRPRDYQIDAERLISARPTPHCAKHYACSFSNTHLHTHTHIYTKEREGAGARSSLEYYNKNTHRRSTRRVQEREREMPERVFIRKKLHDASARAASEKDSLTPELARRSKTMRLEFFISQAACNSSSLWHFGPRAPGNY